MLLAFDLDHQREAEIGPIVTPPVARLRSKTTRCYWCAPESPFKLSRSMTFAQIT